MIYIGVTGRSESVLLRQAYPGLPAERMCGQ